MDDVLKSGYHKSPLGYKNVDWFVDGVVKLENKMAFYFQNTNKDIIMTEENEGDHRKKTFVDFVKKILNLIKLEIIVTWLVNIEVQLIVNVIII